MDIRRSIRGLVAATLAAGALAASAATVPGDFARLSSEYSGWAGGKSNADALVGGLRNGTPITLVTSGTGRSVSMAGFTPQRPMTYTEIRSALRGAHDSLARYGVSNPTAEQIQAALIGGDIEVADGGSRQLAGTILPRG